MFKKKTLTSLLAAVIAFAPAFAHAANTCEGAELIKPGKLVVAFNGDMPGTGNKDGKLVGIDGEIMSHVAQQLGLDIELAPMDWASEIESVKSRRVDIMHGMMGWTEPRTKVIAMTDPIYYAGSVISQRKGSGITSLSQLKDKRVGTLQGYAQVTELKTLNPNVQLYETADAAIRDLKAGRVDVLFIDPPLMQYVATQQPELNIESVPYNGSFDPKLPILTGKFQVVFGMSQQAPKLEKCINDAIGKMWASNENYKIAEKYGFNDKFWFTPQKENPRDGADRSANWQYPKLGSAQ